MAMLTLAGAILFEVAATTLLKATDGFRRPLPTLLSLAGYGLAFWLLALTLRTLPVGVAYAIWSGVGIVLVSAVSAVLYGQMPDGPAILGMGLILAGVLVLQLFSRMSGH